MKSGFRQRAGLSYSQLHFIPARLLCAHMPELPEVQTTVNGINQTVAGLSITDVWTSYDSKHHEGKDNIKDPAYFADFRRAVSGFKILKAERRAKNILIHLSKGKTILLHMKMTGHVMYGTYAKSDKPEDAKDPWKPVKDKEGSEALLDPFNRHIRLVFSLSNKKHLVLSDMRKFAKVTLIDTEEIEKSLHMSHLGPEPLEDAFTFKVFQKQLARRPEGRIKNVLMDQTLISGVGNIYSDEALWLAGIHPEEKPRKVPEEKLKALHKAVKEVLGKGIDFGGDSMSDYRNIKGERGEFQAHHNAYRKTGKLCTKRGCDGIIIRKVVGGRSAHFCSVHQQLAK